MGPGPARLAVVAALGACVLLVHPASADTTRSQSVATGGGVLRLDYTLTCGLQPFDSPSDTRTTWRPTWNAKVTETRETTWRYVRVVYMELYSEETFVKGRVTGSIAPRAAVFDPPRFGVGTEPVSRQAGEEQYGLRIRLNVSKDGATWSTIHLTPMHFCFRANV